MEKQQSSKDHVCAETGSNAISVVYHDDSDNALCEHMRICPVFWAPRQ
jgi:hypothetical protein